MGAGQTAMSRPGFDRMYIYVSPCRMKLRIPPLSVTWDYEYAPFINPDISSDNLTGVSGRPDHVKGPDQ